MSYYEVDEQLKEDVGFSDFKEFVDTIDNNQGLDDSVAYGAMLGWNAAVKLCAAYFIFCEGTDYDCEEKYKTRG